jgi:aldehyde dehydrogenase (NAD+)
VLFVVPVENIGEAIEIINAKPTPLAMYVFTESEKLRDTCTFLSVQSVRFLHNQFSVLERTTSGTLVLNDTYQQLAVQEMPFGGKGESGCTL